jgi:PqqD family protein of HPr-rel-A system
LDRLFVSQPDTLRHEVVGQLHAVFDSVSGRSHFLTAESWEILVALRMPRTRDGHMTALKTAFEIEADGDVDAVLGTRLDELLRLGLAFPV